MSTVELRSNSQAGETGAAPSGSFSQEYRIGDLAREFSVTLRALRFYEDRGLLNPQRNGTTRLYSPRDRSRLKFALFGKRMGFSLVEIKSFLDFSDSEISRAKQNQVALKLYSRQLKVLKQQRADIDSAISELSDEIGRLEENSRAPNGSDRRPAVSFGGGAQN